MLALPLQHLINNNKRAYDPCVLLNPIIPKVQKNPLLIFTKQ